MAKVVPVDNDEELSRSSDVSGVRQVSTTAGASDNDVALVDTYRNSDSDLLDTALRVLGGTRKGVAGDGACQFAAVAAQLDGVSAVTLRKAVVADMERTPPSEADIRAVGGNSPETLETYMAKMRRTDYYGDDLTLVRMCFLQNISVCILSVSEKGCLSLLRHEHGPRYVFLTYRPEHYDRLEAPQHVLTEIVENQPRVQDVLSLVKQGSRPSTAALERENFRASGNGSRHALPEMTSTDGTSESGGESRAPATPRRKPETSPTSEVSTEAEEMPPPPAVILRDETHTPSVSAQQLVLCLEREVDMTIVHYAVLPYLFFLPLFTVYMGFMYMSDKDDGMYHMNTALRKNLMEDEMFKEIDTHDDFYAWLQSTAKNFWVTKDEYDRAIAVRGNASSLNHTRTLLVGINRVQAGNGLFAERQNYPLHFMMLRQKRVEMQPCSAKQTAPLHPEVWRRIENTCIDRLSQSDSEGAYLRNVSRSFPHVNDSTRSVPYPDITTDPFVTDDEKEPQLPPMRKSRGLTHSYSGDKKLYSAKLPYQELFLGDVEKIVSDLKANNWIDFTTRVVVVEAIVYNAVLRVYVVLRYVVEFTHSGHVTSFSTSDPFWQMLLDSGGWHTFAFVCDIAFWLYFLFSLCELCCKYYLSYVMGQSWYGVVVSGYKPWHLIHLICLLSYLWFHSDLWNRLPSDLAAGTNLYGDLLLYQGDFVRAKHWGTAALWLACLRVYEYIRYWPHVHSRVTETIRLAEKELLVVMGLICFITFGFALVANVIYGWHLKEFDTIICSFAWLLRSLIAGDIALYSQMRELEPWWTPIFLLTYRVFTWLILLNVVLGILASAFNDSSTPAEAGWNDIFGRWSLTDIRVKAHRQHALTGTVIMILEAGERQQMEALEDAAWDEKIRLAFHDEERCINLTPAEQKQQKKERVAARWARKQRLTALHDEECIKYLKKKRLAREAEIQGELGASIGRPGLQGNEEQCMILVSSLWKCVFCVMMLREFLTRQRNVLKAALRDDKLCCTTVLDNQEEEGLVETAAQAWKRLKAAFCGHEPDIEELVEPVSLQDLFNMSLCRPPNLIFWCTDCNKEETEIVWKKIVKFSETEDMIREANSREVKSVRSAKLQAQHEDLKEQVSYLTQSMAMLLRRKSLDSHTA